MARARGAHVPRARMKAQANCHTDSNAGQRAGRRPAAAYESTRAALRKRWQGDADATQAVHSNVRLHPKRQRFNLSRDRRWNLLTVRLATQVWEAVTPGVGGAAQTFPARANRPVSHKFTGARGRLKAMLRTTSIPRSLLAEGQPGTSQTNRKTPSGCNWSRLH